MEATLTSCIAFFIFILGVHALIMPLFRRDTLQGKHVLITGGSKGLGLALAREFVRRGCDVSVVARNQTDLLAALQDLIALGKSLGLTPKIQALSADTGSWDELVKAFAMAEEAAGPVEVLFCNAGLSIPGNFIDQPIEEYQKLIDVNYMGTLRTIKCALPKMLARGQGQIVITTSVLSVLGFAGYSSYAPTKWALRGLADCLHNELQGTGVKISVAYPPDTDTPGYAQENLTKPGLCTAVNDAVGSQLFPPDRVAKKMVKQLERGCYHLTTPDIGSNLLISSMTSLAPKSISTVLGIFLAPILTIASTVVGSISDRAARKYNTQKGYPEVKTTT